ETGIVTSSVTGLKPSELEASAGRLTPPPTPLKLGDLHDTRVLLAAGGVGLIAALLYWNVRGGILLGLVLTAAAGYARGVGQAAECAVALPWDEEYDLRQIAGQLDIKSVLRLSFLPILITLCLISFLDTLGTLVGVGAAGGHARREGGLQGDRKADAGGRGL